jgi:hypothetical protein
MASEQAQHAYDPAKDPLAVPRNDAAVQHILNTITDESEQLDAITEARGAYHIDKEFRDTLDAYLAGDTSLEATAETLAALIDESYTSADNGTMLWEMEMQARACRPLCTPDEVLEFWGEPVAMCEPDPVAKHNFSTEGGLWSLWLGLDHASKKTPWTGDDSGRMLKLVQLVQALKRRSNPPLPEAATPALRNNWVWRSGKLWSDLTLLGPSMRESWNDAPGGTMGFTEVEVKAWERENAFVAHLTATGTACYLSYGLWAMRDALEGGIAQIRQLRWTPEMKKKLFEVTLGVVVVWMSIAGKDIFKSGIETTVEPAALVDSGVMSMGRTSTEISDTRWSFWKKRLAQFACDKKISALSRSHAVRAGEEMQRLEEAYGEIQRWY